MAFLLIKSSNLSIKKYISDTVAMLTYFECFLSHLRLCLTGAGSAKAAFVEGVFAGGISARDTSGSTCVDIGLSGTNCWLSIK